MESDSESYDSDTRPTCSTKTSRVGIKRKHYKQKFKVEWCKLKEFSTWLKKHPKDEYKAICSICDSSISAEMSVLKRHGCSTKHEQKEKLLLSSTSKSSIQPTIESAFKKAPTTLDEKCKVAEIKFAAFIAEHKISHQVADHLCDLISVTFIDPEVAKKFKLKHTKAQAVINNVVGRSEKDTLARDLQNCKFSVLIDESTDIAVVKTMCVVVRYYDCNHGKILSRFWDLIQLFEYSQNNYSANAHHLFNLVIQSFEKYSIPLDNIVGFGSDGCNTMMGCRNSISSLFREKCPGITVLKCICHSLHLCASDASKKLPPDTEKFARAIYNYFKLSSKRQAEFKDFQLFTETEVHKILRPAQTRWLSLVSVVNRILEQWDALRLYFDGKWLEDSECLDIHKSLQDPITKAYYYFLAWILPKFTDVNKYFQSESTVIIDMHDKMAQLYRELLSSFMLRSYVQVTKLDDIDPTNTTHYLDLEDMYLGLGVSRQLELPEILDKQDILQEFKINCRKFIVVACVGIRKRYSLNDPVLTALAKLRPELCMSASADARLSTLSTLFNILPRVSPKTLDKQQILDDEWRNFPLIATQIKDIQAVTEKADVFWNKVGYFN